MSITATNITDGIRVDQATQRGSIRDVIQTVTDRRDGSHLSQVLSRILKDNPTLDPKCVRLKINNKGQPTPVADAATLVEIAWLCPGKAAEIFLFNGGVNTAVTGMPIKAYRQIQVNLGPREAAREAFTDSMLGMTGTINALVRDNLAEGHSADEQLEFMQDKCAQAAELLGLHKKAKQVQPRHYIAGNKRVMCIDLAAKKQQKLLQTEQSKAIQCAV